jgi:hypothetical protein
MLENKLRMAAVVSTKTCFGLGARAGTEGAAAPRSVYSTTMLRRQVHQDKGIVTVSWTSLVNRSDRTRPLSELFMSSCTMYYHV